MDGACCIMCCLSLRYECQLQCEKPSAYVVSPFSILLRNFAQKEKEDELASLSHDVLLTS